MYLSNTTLRYYLTTREEVKGLSLMDRWIKYKCPNPIIVEPLNLDNLQPCSLDVHIGDELFLLDTSSVVANRPEELKSSYRKVAPIVESADPNYPGWMLFPGKVYLSTTHEYFEIPIDTCGNLHGVSTNARVGIVPHLQAGLLDPGWKGRVTLEMTVMEVTTIFPIYQGKRMRVGQVTFTPLDKPASPGYQGRYQGDMGATPPKANSTDSSSHAETRSHPGE